MTAFDNIRTRLRAFTSQSRGGVTEIRLAKLYLRVFAAERYRFYHRYGRLLDANIGARDALDYIYDIASHGGRKPGEMMAVAVRYWRKALLEGFTLSEAIRGWVPAQEVVLIEAGERSGRFSYALRIMLDLNERMKAVRSKIFSKLAYPVASALLLCAIIYFLATSFIPQILRIKATGWTGSAASTIGVLQWSAHGLIPAVMIVAIAILVIVGALPFFTGKFRARLDRFPPWSVHRFLAGTAFMTSLLVYMESGKGLRDALELTRRNASPYLASKINKTLSHLREGNLLGKSLELVGENFPDRELISEIQLFDRIGKLDSGLRLIIESWMTEATERMQAQILLLSNLILVSTFGILGFIFNGYYDIINQLTQGH